MIVFPLPVVGYLVVHPPLGIIVNIVQMDHFYNEVRIYLNMCFQDEEEEHSSLMICEAEDIGS